MSTFLETLTSWWQTGSDCRQLRPCAVWWFRSSLAGAGRFRPAARWRSDRPDISGTLSTEPWPVLEDPKLQLRNTRTERHEIKQVQIGAVVWKTIRAKRWKIRKNVRRMFGGKKKEKRSEFWKKVGGQMVFTDVPDWYYLGSVCMNVVKNMVSDVVPVWHSVVSTSVTFIIFTSRNQENCLDFNIERGDGIRCSHTFDGADITSWLTKLNAEEVLHLSAQLKNHLPDILHQTASCRSWKHTINHGSITADDKHRLLWSTEHQVN